VYSSDPAKYSGGAATRQFYWDYAAEKKSKKIEQAALAAIGKSSFYSTP